MQNKFLVDERIKNKNMPTLITHAPKSELGHPKWYEPYRC